MRRLSSLSSGAGVLALALFISIPGLAAEFDAPYVMRDTSGKLESWTLEGGAEGLRKQVIPVPPGGTITVPAVGSLPSFTVKLRPPAENAVDELKVAATAPIFVVADTHGEFEILAQMLIRHRVIDSNLRWSFGRGQLVFLGDVFDRGAHQTEILWLIYSLEAEARRTRGAVHFVLGNHESMVLLGDLRYLNPKYAQAATTLGVGSYRELFGVESVLGQWLRSKPAVLKINDLLCLHGGISAELVDRGLTLAQTNATLRAVLNDPDAPELDRERAGFLLGPNGPLWYRGYFAGHSGASAASADDIGRIRQHFGVGRILVGHTTVPTMTPLYEGQVIAVQVYPKRAENGVVTFEALLIRDGKLLRAKPDGSSEPLMP
jgi:hypothetical protein